MCLKYVSIIYIMLFTFSYFLSIIFALSSVFILHIRLSNKLPKILTYFVVPLVVAYVTLYVFDLFFTKIDDTMNNVGNYLEDKYLDNVRTTKFYTIYPTFILLFVIFSILLYLGLFN